MDTKTLLIMGSLRSGSTILGNTLGQIDGFFSAGELADIWVNVWHNRGMCGCGQPTTECELWSEVFRRAFGSTDGVDGWAMSQEGRLALRTLNLPLMLTPPARAAILRRLGDYIAMTDDLHRAISATTQARVVVDHSKYPAYRHVLESTGTVDLYVLHLVRDPRAVVYSWQRRKAHKGGPPGEMYERPVHTSAKWTIWNAVANGLSLRAPDRYLRVRYEDFIRAPHETLQQIVAFVGEPPQDLPVPEGANKVHLDVTHTVAGNPNRFTTGPVELRYDREWKSAMRRSHKLLTDVVTGPLALRYGYPLSGGPSALDRDDRRRSSTPDDHGSPPSAPGGASHRVVVSELPEVDVAWEALADAVDAEPFLRPGWFAAWSSAFGSLPVKVVTVWRHDRMVGALPVVARSRSVHSPSNAHTPSFGAVVTDDDAAAALSRALLDAHPQSISLEYVDPDDRFARHLDASLAVRRFTTRSRELARSPYTITTGEWVDFERRLSKQRRSEIRRRGRRLAEEGSLSVEVADGTMDLDRLLREGFDVEASGWKGDEGTAIRSSPTTRDFYTAVARWAAAHDRLRLAFLRLDGRAIAFQYLLRCGRSVYYLKGGYDVDFRKFGPGILLSYRVVQQLFADPAVDCFEWLGTDDAYKDEWSDGERRRLRVDAFAPTPRGRVNEAITRATLAAQRAGKDLVRNRVPDAAATRIIRARAAVVGWRQQRRSTDAAAR